MNTTPEFQSLKTRAYDANGNMTTNGTTTFVWDDENRLVEVRRNGETIQQNRYDALGRRREKIEPAITNRYIYKDWLVLAITDGAENALETYTHGSDLSGHLGGGAGGIGGILSSTQSGFSAYYHYDFNGNIVQVTSAAQTPITQLTYTPFGEVRLKEGPFTPRYQFSTKEFDQKTALTYYGYRFYSPALGKWLNRDPVWERGVRFYNLLSLRIDPNLGEVFADANLLAFVRNSPIILCDVLGLACGSGWLGDFIVPDNPGGFPFGPSCEKHDDCYGEGGCKAGKSKEQCDNEFYDSMMQVCMSQPISETYICHGDRLCWRNPKAECEKIAKEYFDFVVKKGQKPFKKARKCCKK